MADWFETRFREPVDVGLDPAFAARVRARVVEEWQADGPATATDATQFDADNHEGEIIMLETETRPNPGVGPSGPRRRPPGQWLMVAAAVAVVAVLGAVLVANSGDDDKIDTATSTPTPTTAPPVRDILSLGDFVELEPGVYSMDPDLDDATPLRVTYQVTADGWESWGGAAKRNDNGHTLLTITTITNVVRDGCLDHSPLDPPVGPTVAALATALSQLTPFEVTAPPSDVTMFGYQGQHLQLTVPNLPFTGTGEDRLFSECQEDSLHSYFFPTPGDSFYGYNGEPGRTEDFWILDVDGTRLVIIKNTSPETPPQDQAELDAMFKSIRIEP